jgi:hypothetical protein
MIKSRRIRLVGQEAQMRKMRNAYTILVRKPEDYLEDLCVDGRLV